jgi:hypothetical protein
MLPTSTWFYTTTAPWQLNLRWPLNLVHLLSPSLAFKNEIPPHCNELMVKRARVVSYFLSFYISFCIFWTVSTPPSEAVRCREAIAEFLTSIHPLIPPYWYKLQGDDVGSLAFLFGLSEAELEALFLRAGGILKQKGKRVQYQRNIVNEGCPLMFTILKAWSLSCVR